MTPLLAIRVAAALSLVLVAAACGGGGAQTIAQNRSGAIFIVRSTDEGGVSRYYALRPAATVVVDDVGEVNPAADTIDLLDTECALVEGVEGDFWDGGVITVDESAVISFAPGRHRSGMPRFLAGPDETTHALTTCEAAVQAAGV